MPFTRCRDCTFWRGRRQDGEFVEAHEGESTEAGNPDCFRHSADVSTLRVHEPQGNYGCGDGEKRAVTR